MYVESIHGLLYNLGSQSGSFREASWQKIRGVEENPFR
jgi:hypothetical protein